MSETMNQNQINEQDNKVVDDADAVLQEDDLEEVSGGGLFGDIYNAVNDAWTDIKNGFMDAWED